MRQRACSILFQKGDGKSWLPQRKKKQNNGVEAEDLGGLKEKRRENMRKKRRLGRGNGVGLAEAENVEEGKGSTSSLSCCFLEIASPGNNVDIRPLACV